MKKEKSPPFDQLYTINKTTKKKASHGCHGLTIRGIFANYYFLTEKPCFKKTYVQETRSNGWHWMKYQKFWKCGVFTDLQWNWRRWHLKTKIVMTFIGL
jgi:hypothetical protein